MSKPWAPSITGRDHLIRNTFRLTSRQYCHELKRNIEPIYTAVNATTARAAFNNLADKWGGRYPAVVRLWDNARAEFIPFLDYDVKIRRMVCSTNAIESLNARYRRAVSPLRRPGETQKRRSRRPSRAPAPQVAVDNRKERHP